MRVIAILLALFVAALPSSYAAFTIFSVGLLPLPDVTCDITTGIATGVGAGTCIASPATCNGTVDDAAAFAAFNTWATTTWQMTHTGLIALSIPAGKNCKIAGNTVACASFNTNQKCPFVGIHKMLLVGEGHNSSTVTIGSGALISFAGIGVASDNLHSARINTVSAGSSCVILPSTPTGVISAMVDNGSNQWRVTIGSTTGFVSGKSYYFSGINGATLANGLQLVQVINGTQLDILSSDVPATQTYTGGGIIGGDRTVLFTVGQYAMIGGLDLQSLYLHPFGAPPNVHYFEHVKVASKNSGTGQVCFDAPLRNGYKSTWPLYNSGSAFQIDPGGPATLWTLESSWDTELEIRGLTLVDGGNQIYAQGRMISYRDVAFSGGSDCAIPTQAISWSVYDSDFSNCNIEVDKLVGTINFIRSTINLFKFQSSSIDLLVMQNSTVTGGLTGTPKVANISNSTFASLGPGAYAYGRSDETICTNCIINGFSAQGFQQSTSDYTMSGGILTFPNTNASGSSPSQRLSVPGTNIFFRGTNDIEGIFQVVDVTQDFANTYIQTSLAGGYPAISGLNSLKTHPAPKFTCTGCTGSFADVASFAAAPATAPLYSYQTKTYTGIVGTTVQSTFQIWGNLSSLTMTVNNAYSGAGNEFFNLSQFNNWPIRNSSNAAIDFNSGTGPELDAKIVGSGLLTLSGFTCLSGSCAGFGGFTVPDAVRTWFTGSSNSGPVFSNDRSSSCPGVNCPSVTVTIQTDQGVVNP